MSQTIELTVFQSLDRRRVSGDSPDPTLELHRLRGSALHDALDGFPGWQVDDWGETDKDLPQESVHLTLSIADHARLSAEAAGTGESLGILLLAAGANAAVADAIRLLLKKLRQKLESREITDVIIRAAPSVTVFAESGELGGKVSLSAELSYPGERWRIQGRLLDVSPRDGASTRA